MTDTPNPFSGHADTDHILRSEIDEHVEDEMTKAMGAYIGTEPWQLRPGEATAVGIDIARYPRMIWAWNFFEAFTGAIDPNDINLPDNAFDRARIVHKDVLDQGATEPAFVAFAAQYAGLTAHEAQVEYAKMNRAVSRKEGQG